jgi:hypothetical protein
MATGDLNADGISDIVVADESSNAVTVLLSQGGNGLASNRGFGVGSAPNAVAIADFNRDGRPDLVVSNGGSNTVSVLLSDVEVLAAPTDPALPAALALAHPYPNPSSHGFRVRFALPRAGFVSLGVFDVAGRRVASLIEGLRPAGEQTASWDGRTSDGAAARAGLYFLRLDSGNERATQRAILVR